LRILILFECIDGERREKVRGKREEVIGKR
jgi:hypothetical protein